MQKAKEKSKEKSVVESIKEMPTLWIRCPRCTEALYVKEVEKTNRCSANGCRFKFPYPVAKALKVETLIKNHNTTYGELSKLILKMLDSIEDQVERQVFLIKVIGSVQENHERRLAQKKN